MKRSDFANNLVTTALAISGAEYGSRSFNSGLSGKINAISYDTIRSKRLEIADVSAIGRVLPDRRTVVAMTFLGVNPFSKRGTVVAASASAECKCYEKDQMDVKTGYTIAIKKVARELTDNLQYQAEREELKLLRQAREQRNQEAARLRAIHAKWAEEEAEIPF